MKDSHRYIVIEGPIGVGKTTLARLFAEHLNARLLLEDVEANPFIRDFYRSNMKNSFPTQLFFLLSRYQQQRELLDTDLFQQHIVSDYLFHKERIFAAITLTPDERSLYYKVYSLLERDILKPDLVVLLYAPVDKLLDRIRHRNHSYEDGLGGEYLKKVSDSYLEFFYDYNDSPLLMVNTEGIDPIDNMAERQMLFDAIMRTRRGRNYFNPPKGTLV
jgi:deoxyguanosine kinase